MQKEQTSRGFLSREDLSLLRRALCYIKPHLPLFCLTFLFVLIGMGLELIQPLLYGRVIDYILNKELTQVWKTLVVIFGLMLVNGGVSMVETYFTDLLGNRIVLDLKKDLYHHILHLPVKVFNELRVGELISRLEGDVGVLSNIISTQSMQIILSCARVIGIGYIVFQLNVTLTLIILAAFPLTYMLLGIFGRILRHKGEEMKKLNDDYYSNLAESFSGIREIKALHIEERIKNKFIQWAEQIFHLRIKTDVINAFGGLTSMVLSQVTSLLVMGVGGYYIVLGTLTMGTYIAFNNYSGQFRMALSQIVGLNSQFQQAMVSLERIFLLIDNFMLPVEEREGVALAQVRGELKVTGLDFSYVPEEPVLRQVEFTAQPGQMTAIVGASGSGKTTLFNLILRFYRPEQGQILLDGVPLEKLDLDFWREQVAVVSQEPFLFNMSIEENLRLARPEATMGEIVAATQKAYIHHFIETLPEGYQTVVGERGTRLSGGQKQRLAIARAILKGATILLFDEATSALDGESEEVIQETLRTLMRDHTVIVIAHRLATVIHAAQIVVLDEGRVSGCGTHDQLIQQNVTYQRLYQSQWNSLKEKITGQVEIVDAV